MRSNLFSTVQTTFRFLTGAAKSCLILGRMLNIRVDCGGRHRSTAFEVRTRNGMFLSILTHSQPRKAKIGYGAADCRCRERMTGPSFTYLVPAMSAHRGKADIPPQGRDFLFFDHTGHHACVLAARGGASRPLPER